MMRPNWFLLSVAMTLGGVTAAQALTSDEIKTRLEAAGYSQVREVGSGKIKTFRAVKDGRERSVIVDSSGHINEPQ
jgi:predicted RNA binding protein YcfA (HicA-like mRNA interferase family)